MFARILARSMRGRKARLALATLSVVLGASLVAALANLSLDVPQKASLQLRAYGANIFILPQSPVGDSVHGSGTGPAYISEKDLSYLAQGQIARAVLGYTPYLYSLAEIEGRPLVLAGVAFDTVPLTSPYWQVRGRNTGEVRDESLAIVGARAAEKLGLGLDTEFTVNYGNNSRLFRVAGIVSTGDSEEDQVFVGLKAAQELTGLEGKVGLVRVSAQEREYPLYRLARLIEQGMPATEVRVLGQIAAAESRVLAKVQLLMALVAALILTASGLVILSTMTTTLLERTAEIGLMKALGAPDRRIAGLFGAEIGAIALGSGLLGYGLGYALAQFIGHRVFAAAVSPRPVAFLVTVAVATVVTLAGSTPPLRRAMRIDPALTLRGE